MADDAEIADEVIPGSLKRSRSYHADYGRLTCGEIRVLASSDPPDGKARQLKKLIEQTERLQRNGKGRRS